MAERKRNWNKEDDLPVYLARPGTTAQTPRQKYGGMFASVEGAYENKTIDFDAYSVGKKGSRTPRSGSRHDMLDGGDNYSETASDISEVSGSVISSPGDREDKTPGVEIRYPVGKELLQGQDNGQVSGAGAGPRPGGGETPPPLSGASRAVPGRAVPQSPARRRGGTGAAGAGEFRYGRSGRHGPLLPGTVMPSEEPGWPLNSHLPERAGGRPHKSFSFVSDGDEFSPFPFLPVKPCPCRLGWRAAPAPPAPPRRPPGTKQPPPHFGAGRENSAEPVPGTDPGPAPAPALPLAPPAPHAPSLSPRQGARRAGGSAETFAWGVPHFWGCDLGSSCRLKDKVRPVGLASPPASCASPS